MPKLGACEPKQKIIWAAFGTVISVSDADRPTGLIQAHRREPLGCMLSDYPARSEALCTQTLRGSQEVAFSRQSSHDVALLAMETIAPQKVWPGAVATCPGGLRGCCDLRCPAQRSQRFVRLMFPATAKQDCSEDKPQPPHSSLSLCGKQWDTRTSQNPTRLIPSGRPPEGDAAIIHGRRAGFSYSTLSISEESLMQQRRLRPSVRLLVHRWTIV